jgi:preprotein translocase subunit Sss1
MADRAKRLGWFVAIWAMSVLVLGIVGYIIRFVLKTE